MVAEWKVQGVFPFLIRGDAHLEFRLIHSYADQALSRLGIAHDTCHATSLLGLEA